VIKITTTCTGRCNQGRTCTCDTTGAKQQKPQHKGTSVFVIFRLFRFYRRSGMTRANALSKAVATVKRDMQFKVGK
jgi:hypothetical protein